MKRRSICPSAATTAFWLAVAFTAAAALLPPGRAPQLLPWDKAEHFAAFYVLGLLALAGFPAAPGLIIGLCLSLFGAGIELAQALPFVHRDCDVWDAVANAAGAAAALLPAWLVRVRSAPALRRH